MDSCPLPIIFIQGANYACATRQRICNEIPSMRAVAKILRARASENTSSICEQFEQRPNLFSAFETLIIVTICILVPPRSTCRSTCCGNVCFGGRVRSEYGTWYSERVTLQFMCVGSWAGTVLMSPRKDETAVHCWDPALSVLVSSQNVFHTVLALQSTVFAVWRDDFQIKFNYRIISSTFIVE